MGSLPQSVALKADYLKITGQYMAVSTAEGSRRGCIELSTEAGVLDSTARFNVEQASDGLVHIKSLYNNKYLCRKSEDSRVIAAAASEKDEKYSWSCTLFRPRIYGNRVGLYHIGTKGPNNDEMIDVDEKDLSVFAHTYGFGTFLFDIVDVEAIVRLPKRVSFKGDNGKYLCSHIQNGIPYNSFSCDDNKEEVSHYEIFPTKDGDIHIKSVHFKQFLRCNGGWIVGDVASIAPGEAKPAETFKAVKVGDNVIALLNMLGEYCRRLGYEDGKSNCLKACESSVAHEGRFVVEEPVFDRKIDVQFQFNDARIYDRQVSQTATISVVNETNEKHELSQGFTYTKTHTGTWGSSDQLNIAGEAKLKAGIPFLVQGSFKLSAGYTRIWTRGQSDDYSKQITSTYTVPVPVKTKVTVNLVSEEAKYDIPYSYYQTDTYTSGEKVTTLMNDGIYHGVEAYDFCYQPTYERLSPESDEITDGKVIIISPTASIPDLSPHPGSKILLS